jgi:hypothetical protein
MVGTVLSGPLQRAAGVDEPPGRRERRTCGILSAVGDVSYTRWYAVDADGKRGFPADEALGIVCGCTPGAAKRLCHMGARSQSYADASESLALLSGIIASSNTIQRLVGTVGPDMAAWAREREPATVHPGRDLAVGLEMDMTGVRLLKKYLRDVKGKDGPPKGRQIKCGVVFLLERGEDGLYHKVPDSSVHILSFSDVTDFSTELDKARQKLGAKHVARLIVISDGAEWIWKIVEDRFKQAFAVVDFWHAADHLHDLCEFVHGKGDAATGSFISLRRKLKRYGVNCVIRHFESTEASRRKRKGINKRLQYFRTHQARSARTSPASDGHQTERSMSCGFAPWSRTACMTSTGMPAGVASRKNWPHESQTMAHHVTFLTHTPGEDCRRRLLAFRERRPNTVMVMRR